MDKSAHNPAMPGRIDVICGPGRVGAGLNITAEKELTRRGEPVQDITRAGSQVDDRGAALLACCVHRGHIGIRGGDNHAVALNAT